MTTLPSSNPREIHRTTVQGYRVGFREKPPATDLDLIIASLRKPPAQSTDPLQGRLETRVLALPTLGRVVVKHYARGGWMRYVSRRLHLRSWTSRAEVEFRVLHSLAADGVAVPTPLLWAERGQFLVHKWLITAEIPHSTTLAEIAQHNPSRAVSLLPEVVSVIQSLITRRVHHVDFHPGNVLIDHHHRALPIDFDKASRVDFNPPDLAERYRRRWNRSIVKHQLPRELQLSVASLQPAADIPSPASVGIQAISWVSLLDPILPVLPF